MLPRMPALTAIAERIERARPAVLVALLLLLQTALELPGLGSPPTGFHLWRQTQTLLVARNFHEEGMNPLLPRVDSRGAGPGIAGMEFPLVSYLIAAGYRVFGEHDAVHRLVLLAMSFLAIAGCYAWAQGLLGSRLAGFAAGLFLALSPLFDYYSVAALPDAPMLGFLFCGMAWIQRGAGSAHLRPAIAGCAALTVAALVKVSALLAWPAALLCLVPAWRSRTLAWRGAILGAATVGIGLVVTWYAYAAHLSAVYRNYDFLLATMWPYPPHLVALVLRKVVVQWLPEVYLSYPEFALFLAGLVVLARARRHAAMPVLLAYAAGLAAYMAAYLPRLEIHDYHMIVAIPPLVLITTMGALALVDGARSRRAAAATLAVLTLAAMVVGPLRAQSRHQHGRVHPDLATLAAHLDRVLPDRRAPVIVASDPSPSIYLYFAHRKGWSASADIAAGRLRAMAAQGARYLVSDSRPLEAREDVRPWLRRLSSHGKFNVFGIAAPETRSPPDRPIMR